MTGRNRASPPLTGRQRRNRDTAVRDPRERLLDVALGLFARHGFEGVSTNMIAARAGLSQPMVYYHFRSKDDLWQSAVAKLMRELGERYPRNNHDLKDLSPAARLSVMVRRFIQMSFSDARLAQIIITESISRSERLDWFARSYLKAGYTEFDTTIASGMEAGQFKTLPLYVVTNTLVAASSLIFCVAPLVEKLYGVDVSCPDSHDEVADTVVDILFNGLLTRTGPP